MRIVALEDAVAVAIDTERHAVSRDHGLQSVEIAERVFWFELKVSGEDLAGGVVLKAMRVSSGPRPSSNHDGWHR